MPDPTDGWTPPAPDPGTPPPAAAPAPPAGWQAPPGWGPSPAAGSGWGQPGWGAPRPPEARPGVIPLRPLALGELLDGAVQVVRRYPRPTLGLSAVVAAVFAVLNAVLLVVAFAPLADLPTDSGEITSFDDVDAEIGGFLAGAFGGLVLQGLATVILAGVITSIVGKAVLGQPVSLREAWLAVRPMLGRLVGLAVVVGLAVWGTFVAGVLVAVGLGVALGAPGALVGVPLAVAATAAAVYLYVRLSLAPCVAVLERAGVRTSLTRSGVLVRRSWWRACGVLALTWLIAFIVEQVISTPFALTSGAGAFTGDVDLTSPLYVLSTAIGGGIAAAVVAPFETGVRALLYVDRRMRAEGLDVALQATAAVPAPAAPNPS